MWFQIPDEHINSPEAQRLLKLDAEFGHFCAKHREASLAKLHETDPAASEALDLEMRQRLQALTDAAAEFDRATGEPKPVELPAEVLQKIATQFAPADQEEVIAILSKTLGYLQRQQVGGRRVIDYVLILARGKKELLQQYADTAKSDYRDIIFWVQNPDESRLDTPAKIEDFQETLEWLGEQRDPELDEEQRRMLASNHSSETERPWWRFWGT